jgi:hypothetical protein
MGVEEQTGLLAMVARLTVDVTVSVAALMTPRPQLPVLKAAVKYTVDELGLTAIELLVLELPGNPIWAVTVLDCVLTETT